MYASELLGSLRTVGFVQEVWGHHAHEQCSQCVTCVAHNVIVQIAIRNVPTKKQLHIVSFKEVVRFCWSHPLGERSSSGRERANAVDVPWG